jgi:putative tricarboxylic transport membrane protein
MIDQLIIAFLSLLTPTNLLVCMIGALYGTLVGVLPGVGPAAAAAIISPILMNVLSIEHAAIILTSIMYGAQYGGSTGAILLNIPGEASSAITTLDGHPMAKQGRVGEAIFIAALASFIAGILSVGFIAFASSVAMSVAFKLTAIHYLTFLSIALVVIVMSFNNNYIKNMIAMILGFLLSLMGMAAGSNRFNFGISTLHDGIDVALFVVCMFGFAEVIYRLTQHSKLTQTAEPILITKYKISAASVKRNFWPAVRGSVLGFLGALPGFSYSLPTILSYNLEKRISKTPEKFGTGMVEGVSGPEAANNSASQTSFIPLLMLGIPTGAITTMLAALLISKGIQLGPQVSITNPHLFWMIILSMLIVNVFLLILNWPLAAIWTRLLTIKESQLNLVILLGCVLSVAIICINITDVLVAGMLVGLGVMLKYAGFNVVHTFVGFIFGVLVEDYFLRSISLSKYNISLLLQDWIWVLAVILCFLTVVFLHFKRRSK